jgi:hypothetical protein
LREFKIELGLIDGGLRHPDLRIGIAQGTQLGLRFGQCSLCFNQIRLALNERRLGSLLFLQSDRVGGLGVALLGSSSCCRSYSALYLIIPASTCAIALLACWMDARATSTPALAESTCFVSAWTLSPV